MKMYGVKHDKCHIPFWYQAALVSAEFRLDVGFGNYENVALLIEMGYEVYTKPHSHREDPAARHLPAWFAHYHSRQTIEAGINESQQVFYLHHIKVRSEPAIFLQECGVIFAANFICWASHWLAHQAQSVENSMAASDCITVTLGFSQCTSMHSYLE